MKYYKCNGNILVWKEDHATPCTECKEIDGAQSIKRAQGLAVLKGQNLVVFSCPDACVVCNTEERGSLWVTTDASPRPLDELLDTTAAGKK